MANINFIESGYAGSISPVDMAFSDPVNSLDINFVDAGYTGVSSPIDINFGTAPVVPAVALQGNVVVVGGVPTEVIATVALQGNVVIVGGVPTEPELVTAGDIAVTGETPALILGYLDQPDQGSVSAGGRFPTFTGVDQLDISVEGLFPSFTDNIPGQGDVTVTGLRPGGVTLQAKIADTIIIEGLIPSYDFSIVGTVLATGYRTLCVLTGGNDGLSDVVLPISSHVSRLSASLSTSVTVVVPNGIDYADEISARPNGTLVISTVTLFSDGSEVIVTSPEYPLVTVRSDHGARSYSVTITAGITDTTVNRKNVLLHDISLISSQANGSLRVRAALESEAKVGDYGQFENGDLMIISGITNVINASSRYMEVVSETGIIPYIPGSVALQGTIFVAGLTPSLNIGGGAL